MGKIEIAKNEKWGKRPVGVRQSIVMKNLHCEM